MLYDYAIVGGGIAGLSLAFFLKERGAKVCLLEANDKLGGVISSKFVDGFLCETAAQSLQSNVAVEELIGGLNLQDRVILPKAEFSTKYIYLNGKLSPVPSSLTGFFSTDLLTIPAKFKVVSEFFSSTTMSEGVVEDESVQSFVTRKFGQEFTNNIFTALVNGIWAGDVTTLSIRSSFPIIWKMEKEYGSLLRASFFKATKRKVLSFKSGMQDLVLALASYLGEDNILLNFEVEKIELDPDYVNVQNKVKAKYLILATEANSVSRLLAPFAAELASVISNINYSPLGLIHMVLDAEPKFGAGFLSAAGKEAVIGALCSSNAFERRAPVGKLLLTCFVGGAKRPDQCNVFDSQIEAIALDQITKCYKVRPKVINKVCWQKAIPNYDVGHYKLQEMVRTYNLGSKRIKLFGSWLDGAGIGSIVENAKQFSITA